jgi:hypothetical protein
VKAARKIVKLKIQEEMFPISLSTIGNKSIRKLKKCNLKIFILKEIHCRWNLFFKRKM